MTVDYKDFTLCSNHDFLEHGLMRIKKGSMLTREEINEMLKILRTCKKQGQAMENRLKKYRRAIEQLGFKRN